MKKTQALASLACIGFTGFASATLISPITGPDPDTSVTTTGGDGDTGTWGVGQFIDGTGLEDNFTATSFHDATNINNGGRALNTGGAVTFDIALGGSFEIDGFVLWNGGEDDRPGNGRTIAQRDQTDRGVQTAILSTSSDGINFVSQGTFSFTREFFDVNAIPVDANGDPDLTSNVNAVGPIAGQARSFAGGSVENVSFIRFDVTENFGDNSIVNISEIAFNQVPEPSTSLLGALGLGLLFIRRKR